MKLEATPEMIAAAWASWHSRHGGRMGPGPGFVEAIEAALAAGPALDAIETLTRERDEAREALKWKPMETAPQDREILLDISYWYPGDTSVTACYVPGWWDIRVKLWECAGEHRRSDQINAWMNIPGTTLPRPAPEALAGGKPE